MTGMKGAICCCCCECIVKLVSFILAFAVNSLITLVIIVCTVSFIVWAMLRHNAVKFQVQNAELTRFNIDPVINNSNNLHYNLSINFSIRNSNSHLGIHYDRFEARVYYDRNSLAATSVPSFYQGHKTTAVVRAVFQGQNLVLLGDHGRRKFEDDRKTGIYGVDVELEIRARLMFGLVNTWRFKPRVRCWLRVQLRSSVSPGGGFQSNDCHIHF